MSLTIDHRFGKTCITTIDCKIIREYVMMSEMEAELRSVTCHPSDSRAKRGLKGNWKGAGSKQIEVSPHHS